MVTCIIIEDQLTAQRILTKYISEFSQLELAGTFSNVFQAKEVLNSQHIDLMFLDIHLPKISGIDFLKSLRNPPNVILTTAFSEYAIESYELNVIDYLLKPFSLQRFEKAVQKVFKRNKPDEEHSIFIKSGHEHIKIKTNSILFINSDSDYTDIYTENGKFIASESLKFWEDKLSKFDFIRVHKSFIVNAQHVEKSSARFLFIKGNNEIPIGRTYKDSVKEQLKL